MAPLRNRLYGLVVFALVVLGVGLLALMALVGPALIGANATWLLGALLMGSAFAFLLEAGFAYLPKAITNLLANRLAAPDVKTHTAIIPKQPATR